MTPVIVTMPSWDCHGNVGYVCGSAYLLVALVLLEMLEQGDESLERRPPAKLEKED